LIGRERERTLIRRALDEIRDGGRAVVVDGEAGIGKSALLAGATAEARDRGMTVLSSTGVQTEAHLPFAGLHQLLRPVLPEVRTLPLPQRQALQAALGMGDAATRELADPQLAAWAHVGPASTPQRVRKYPPPS
jgi:predicted ATPase